MLRNRSKRLTEHVNNVAVYFYCLSKQISISPNQYLSTPYRRTGCMIRILLHSKSYPLKLKLLILCGVGGIRTLVLLCLTISVYRFQHYKHTNNFYK